ncbi:hypothetical protein Tco_0500071, partial [Tanacetum coccineum]
YSEVYIIGSNKPKLSEAEDSTQSNHDTGKVPSNESKRNTTDHSIVVSNSSATDYDSADESSVCSIPLPPLEKLTSAEPVSGPKTIKSILKSKSTFKAETLKGITINEPSSAPARGNKSSLVSKTNSASAKLSKTCGSNVHTTSDHNDIEWFRKKGALQDKKAESFKASKTESSSALRSKTPTKRIRTKTGSISLFIGGNDPVDHLAPVFFLTPTGGIYGEVGVNTFRNAIGAHYLPHSRKYVAPPSIDIMRPWFETIGYGEVVPAKGTLKKSLLPPRWRTICCLYAAAVSAHKGVQSNGGSSNSHTPCSKKTGHSKIIKESRSAMDSNPSTAQFLHHVDTGMHKEAPAKQLVVNLFRASFIIHSESASGNDASAVSTAEVDPRKSAFSDFIPQQQGMNKGTKITSYDHSFAGTDPHVLADQTKYVSEGLEIVLAQPLTGKGASSIARQVKEEEASSTIKLEDLAKLVSNMQPSFKDLDSPEDDPVIIVDSDEDGEDEVHTTTNDETENTSVPKSSSPRKAEAKVALLKAQPSFPNVGQLNELLVKSLKTKFSKILSARDFSSSLPTKLKDLPSKFDELTKEVKGLKKQVHELEIELPRDLKEIPTKLEDFTKNVASVQAKLNTLDALPSLLLNVTKALNKFTQVLDSTSSKAGDQSVPSAGQADTMPVEGEKNTNQASISQLF